MVSDDRWKFSFFDVSKNVSAPIIGCDRRFRYHDNNNSVLSVQEYLDNNRIRISIINECAMMITGRRSMAEASSLVVC